MDNKKYTDDDYLALMVKEDGNEDALNTLIDRHSGICHKIYNKYFYSNTSAIASDLREQKDLLIYQAAKTFNPDCGAKFSTWLGNIVTYACLNACNSIKKEINVEQDIFNYLIDSNKSSENFENEKTREMLSHIENIINLSTDNLSKEVIKMRYFSGSEKTVTFKEIADHFGVSTQTVVNWHDKFIKLLRNKLKSESNIDIL
jgi:RNA polymerase sigma factor (sigma-70 family)